MEENFMSTYMAKKGETVRKWYIQMCIRDRLWVPLLCFCFYQAVRRYLSNAPYRMYLYASSVCLIALTLSLIHI